MRSNAAIILGILGSALLPSLLSAAPSPSGPSAVDIRFVTDEDWRRLFATEGYTRLAQRESAAQGDAPVLWSSDLLRAVGALRP